MKEIYLKIISEDLSEYLSKIKIPTVIIWGNKDNVTPIKDAYFINSRIKNSKLEIFPGIGHNFHSEAPEKLGDRVSQELL